VLREATVGADLVKQHGNPDLLSNSVHTKWGIFLIETSNLRVTWLDSNAKGASGVMTQTAIESRHDGMTIPSSRMELAKISPPGIAIDGKGAGCGASEWNQVRGIYQVR
jgi:hypothetical protein